MLVPLPVVPYAVVPDPVVGLVVPDWPVVPSPVLDVGPSVVPMLAPPLLWPLSVLDNVVGSVDSSPVVAVTAVLPGGISCVVKPPLVVTAGSLVRPKVSNPHAGMRRLTTRTTMARGMVKTTSSVHK